MSPVKFCPEHGPYDASFKSCPTCGSKPEKPQSLDDLDVVETEIGFHGSTRDFDADRTVIPGRRSSMDDSSSNTVISSDVGRYLDETRLPDRTALTEAILWIKEGNRRGHFYPVKNGTVIGRTEGTIILDDQTVSGTHAKITFEKNHLMIWDFASANGTFVNGKRIREATVINENDTVRIGATTFVLKLLYEKKKAPKTASVSRKSLKSAEGVKTSKASGPAPSKKAAASKKSSKSRKPAED